MDHILIVTSDAQQNWLMWLDEPTHVGSASAFLFEFDKHCSIQFLICLVFKDKQSCTLGIYTLKQSCYLNKVEFAPWRKQI